MSPRTGRPDWTLRAHATLAAVSVFLAALAWGQPDWLRPRANATVLPGARGALRALTFRVGPTAWRLAPEKGRLRVWRREATGGEGGAAGSAGDLGVGCDASAAAEALWARLGRLRAARALGRLSAAQREAAGLDSPRGTLTLHTAGADASLAIGGTAYGRGERFVQNDAGEAFLLPSGALAPLGDGAEALCAPPDAVGGALR